MDQLVNDQHKTKAQLIQELNDLRHRLDSVEGIGITEHRQAEEELARLLHDKGERVKELECIYGVAESVQTRDTLEDIFRDVVKLIPSGWHYPGITRGKVVFEGIEYVSKPFTETEWKQSSEIIINGEPRGAIEVYYLEERPILDEGPFMTEERELVDAIAERLGRVGERMQAEEALRESEERISTTLRSIGDAVIATDAKGIVTLMNPVAEGFTGWEEAEAIGKPLEDVFNIINEQTKEQAENPVDRVLREGVVVGLANHTVLIAKDGTRLPIDDSGAPIWDEEGNIIGTVMVFRDITERKLVEEALRDSRQMLQTVLDSIPSAVFWKDRDSIYLGGNSIWLEVVGLKSSDEVAGKSDNDLPWGKKQADSFREYDRKIMDSDIPEYDIIEPYLRADGTHAWAKTNKVPLHDTEGNVVGILGTYEDITERKLTEQALRESEAQLRVLFDGIDDALFVHDQGGRILECNEAACRRLGYSRQELLAMTVKDIDKPEFAKDYEKRLSEQLVKKHLICEGVHLAKDGRHIPVDINSSLIDYQGQIAILAVMRDITERKLAEESLAKSEQDLRILYNNAMEGIFRTTPDGKFLFANPAMAKMFGYESVEDLLKINTADQYIDAKQREEVKALYTQNDHIKNWESEMLRKDGSKVWVRISSSAVKDEDGNTKWYEGFVSDITESKKLEMELLKSQKIESVGLLAGGLAHDFNNALTSIQLQATVASLKEAVPTEVMEILEGIYQSVTKAKAITQQMLTFSKGGAPLRATTNIVALIQESVQFALSGTNITPTFEIDHDLHNSEVDQNQINQVISNLIINAQHAMPMGGKIKISGKNISVTPTSQLGPLKPGEYISISIEDQGHGIEPANLDKIFDPYFTTKQAGSGLGLFACYSIIDKHDGWLTAESEMGEGSTFTFYLPISTEDLAESPKKIADRGVVKGTGTILIMDDEPLLRTMLSSLLESIGYSISVSADGEEAIEMYSSALEADTTFDLVILDLTIPDGLGGAETIKRLIEIDPEVNAIVSSGYSNDSVVINYKDHGFSAVLPKPYSLEVLAEVVKVTIGNRKI
ncbi:PAS domain S-box protein [Candidatus Neomarinimicrobiota bacterium]